MLYGQKEFESDWAEMYRKRKQFRSLLHHLKQDGMVMNKEKGGSVVWRITEKGREKLHTLQKQRKNLFSRLHTSYPKMSGTGFTVITYDIPERDRKKRNWLRIVLGTMEFKMLQKSVWISKGGLPEEFVHALRERNMLSCLQIFSVSGKGTIREII